VCLSRVFVPYKSSCSRRRYGTGKTLAALRFHETGSSNGNRVGFSTGSPGWVLVVAGHLLATLTFRLLCATSKRVHSVAYSKSLRMSDIVLARHGCLHEKMDLRLHVDRRRQCCSIPALRTDYAPRGFFIPRRYLIDTRQHARGHWRFHGSGPWSRYLCRRSHPFPAHPS